MYGIEENQMFLAPTARVPVTNIEREKILSEEELPIKYTAHTPALEEAGSAGTGNRGLIRMHQFDKVELVKLFILINHMMNRILTEDVNVY